PARSLLFFFSVVLRDSSSTLLPYSSLTQVMFTLPNSRSNETEADRMGVELAARAGYDPRAAITLWQKMERAGGGGQPEILSTHPSSQSRIADLKQASEIVLPLYQGRKS